MKKKNKDIFQLVLAVMVLVFFTLVLVWAENTKVRNIDTFEECMNQGYPIMEIYPPICTTPDGRSFTQELTDEEKKNLLPPTNGVICTDQCGDGICQEVVCQGSGCPCSENIQSCSSDCKD